MGHFFPYGIKTAGVELSVKTMLVRGKLLAYSLWFYSTKSIAQLAILWKDMQNCGQEYKMSGNVALFHVSGILTRKEGT